MFFAACNRKAISFTDKYLTKQKKLHYLSILRNLKTLILLESKQEKKNSSNFIFRILNAPKDDKVILINKSSWMIN